MELYGFLLSSQRVMHRWAEGVVLEFLFTVEECLDKNHLEELLAGDWELTSATRYPHGPGVPAVFSSSWFEELGRIEGDKGAKRLLMDRREELRLVHPQTLPFDVYTPEDYERLMSGRRTRD
jgi:molybdenum cofactor cytidylyltransferase